MSQLKRHQTGYPSNMEVDAALAAGIPLFQFSFVVLSKVNGALFKTQTNALQAA